MPKLTRAILLLASIIPLSLFAKTEEEQTWERHVIASCLILEAANQGQEGLQAVASVIANRANRQPENYLAVVQHPYAFSALNKASTDKTGEFGYDRLIRRASKDINWPLALSIVDQLFENTLLDNTFGADHYSRKDELPSWSHGMRATVVIGDHLFFKR